MYRPASRSAHFALRRALAALAGGLLLVTLFAASPSADPADAEATSVSSAPAARSSRPASSPPATSSASASTSA